MGFLRDLFRGKDSADALFNKAEAMIQSDDLASALVFFRQMLKQAESEGAGRQMRNRLFNLTIAIHNGARQRNDQVGGNI